MPRTRDSDKAYYFENISRYVSTICYLRPRQVLEQARRRLHVSVPFVDKRAVRIPQYEGSAWPQDVLFLPPGQRSDACLCTETGHFTFLNAAHELGFPPQWFNNNPSKLWQYNLHYFDWIWGLGLADAKRSVLDWMVCCPAHRNGVGWEPYPVSLRLLNWCGFFYGRHRKATETDSVFCCELWASIVAQADWLGRHLERHLLGNHYLENGAALAFTGSCFAGAAAYSWFKKGLDILGEQVREQILQDGMHFELSPMYHSRVLFLLVTLMRTGSAPLIEALQKPVRRMLDALSAVCHPDGQIALLSDSAFGISNTPGQLREYAYGVVQDDGYEAAPSSGCFMLKDSGYYGWRSDDGTYVICDFGKIGPDYLPGHAHADMFSYELSLKGQRVIVDSGVFDYEASEMRQYCRSTAAHNALEVDGLDQCEMWGVFRVGRRGYPYDVRWEPNGVGFRLSGWHDGYRRVSGHPIHERRVNWDYVEGLHIEDVVRAQRPVRVASRIHFHPACQVVRAMGNQVEIRYPKGVFHIVNLGEGKLALEQGWYCPEFGVKIKNDVICLSHGGRSCRLAYRVVW